MTIHVIECPYDSGWRDRRMGRGVGVLVRDAVLPAMSAAGQNIRRRRVDDTARQEVENATAFALHHAIAEAVVAAMDEEGGGWPLVVAGNCNSAVGTVTGLQRRYGAESVAVVWLDAHADCETPDTTESAFLDGMGLAMLAGVCWRGPLTRLPGFVPLPGARLLLAGARQVSAAERGLIAESGIHRLSVPDVVRLGPEKALAPILEAWTRGGIRAVYLHIDVDVLDPDVVAPANSFAEPGGLTPAQVRTVVETVAAAVPLGAAALTAYDPACDTEGRLPPAVVTLVDALAHASRA